MVNHGFNFSFESDSPDGKQLTIAGTVRYQACDSKTCFLPASAQVQWQLKVLPLDRQRAPEEIRHK